MSIVDTIKRIFSGGGVSRDDESDEQEEFGAPDRGVAELHGREPDPLRPGAGSVGDALEDEFRAPRDPAP
jgi:hypothetical protein